ncbi:Predicted ATPase [Micromonospora pallida]|uniref:Predicted ATPase n=1 Tax=Micromonospora pallida TaxID=145854 RepID=A0A1C6TKK4_9ACTN|nr:BTAD domain-containing putative transcriptional regulator [Micromonospora pallida]SCL42093.1 Predicted ATPase [Micromonospora pallida]
MEFWILGPTEVTEGGRSLAIGGPKPRAALAALLLDANRIVSVEGLVDAVWGDQPPPSAVNALQTYVSRLRRVLGAETLCRHPAGYRLVAAPDLIDGGRFERLLAEGRTALAAGDPRAGHRAVEEALALWRGPALLDVGDAPFAQAEIARLGELRLVAAEARVEAMLALGDVTGGVAAARALVADQPLRERGVAHLMLALYRDGRQSEALATYHEARRLLVDEFGLDPGDDLATLAQAILRQDPELLTVPSAAGSSVPVGTVPPAAGLAVPVGTAPAGTGSAGTGSAGTGSVAGPTAPAPTARAALAPPARSRLVLPLDRFVGRDHELAEVRRLLETHRLVTLTGPGGGGKTRLAREVCRRLTRPVHVVELAGLHDAALLEATVAQAFGLAVLSDLDALVAAVGDAEAVLLLDNCEHLTGALADVTLRLLTDLPGLRVLATSQRPLEVGGERRFPVPPLPVDTTAVELFLDRAAAVAPDWSCGPADREVVTRICARLDGLPLAVELAAAQLTVLSPVQILDRLGRSLAITSTRSDLPDRHRSLERTIDNSYRLLDGAQRDLFARLSVFADTFDLDAAETVAGAGADVLTPLTGLITGSLVATTPAGSTTRRYRMLEILRAYADRLLGPDDRQRLRHRHLDWALALARTADQGLRGPEAPHWYRTLAAEQANTRAALAFALAAGQPLAGMRLATDLSWYWYHRGHLREGVRWLRETIDAVPEASPIDRARALTALASLLYLAGRLEESGAANRAALDLARTVDDPAPVARAYIYESYYLAMRGQAAAAAAAGENGVRHARESGVDWLLSEALSTNGYLARARGDLDTATATLDEAIRIGTRIGYRWSVSNSHWFRAKVAADAGATDDAYEAALVATRGLDELADVTGWLAALHLLAGTLGMTGRAADGAVLLGAVAGIGGRVGYSPELMDPYDSPREIAAVTSALSPAAYAQARQAGLTMDRAAVRAFVDRLAADTVPARR